MRVAFVTAMPSEMKPLRGRLPAGAVSAITGIGTRRATQATEKLLAEHPDVERVLMIGVAGGLTGTEIGQVIVPEVVIDRATGRELGPEPIGGREARGVISTGDDLLIEPGVVAKLEAAGVTALDMETAAVGMVCEAHEVPWSVFRAISDRSGDGLVDDAIFRMAKPDGAPDFRAVAGYVARKPWKLPALAKLGRDLGIATKAAADAALAAIG
jgi:nucleoside phosphorylase